MCFIVFSLHIKKSYIIYYIYNKVYYVLYILCILFILYVILVYLFFICFSPQNVNTTGFRALSFLFHSVSLAQKKRMPGTQYTARNYLVNECMNE